MEQEARTLVQQMNQFGWLGDGANLKQVERVLAEALRATASVEREACFKIANNEATRLKQSFRNDITTSDYSRWVQNVADAIRARGKP